MSDEPVSLDEYRKRKAARVAAEPVSAPAAGNTTVNLGTFSFVSPAGGATVTSWSGISPANGGAA